MKPNLSLDDTITSIDNQLSKDSMSPLSALLDSFFQGVVSYLPVFEKIQALPLQNRDLDHMSD